MSQNPDEDSLYFYKALYCPTQNTQIPCILNILDSKNEPNPTGVLTGDSANCKILKLSLPTSEKHLLKVMVNPRRDNIFIDDYIGELFKLLSKHSKEFKEISKLFSTYVDSFTIPIRIESSLSPDNLFTITNYYFNQEKLQTSTQTPAIIGAEFFHSSDKNLGESASTASFNLVPIQRQRALSTQLPPIQSTPNIQELPVHIQENLDGYAPLYTFQITDQIMMHLNIFFNNITKHFPVFNYMHNDAHLGNILYNKRDFKYIDYGRNYFNIVLEDPDAQNFVNKLNNHIIDKLNFKHKNIHESFKPLIETIKNYKTFKYLVLKTPGTVLSNPARLDKLSPIYNIGCYFDISTIVMGIIMKSDLDIFKQFKETHIYGGFKKVTFFKIDINYLNTNLSNHDINYYYYLGIKILFLYCNWSNNIIKKSGHQIVFKDITGKLFVCYQQLIKFGIIYPSFQYTNINNDTFKYVFDNINKVTNNIRESIITNQAAQQASQQASRQAFQQVSRQAAKQASNQAVAKPKNNLFNRLFNCFGNEAEMRAEEAYEIQIKKLKNIKQKQRQGQQPQQEPQTIIDYKLDIPENIKTYLESLLITKEELAEALLLNYNPLGFQSPAGTYGGGGNEEKDENVEEIYLKIKTFIMKYLRVPELINTDTDLLINKYILYARDILIDKLETLDEVYKNAKANAKANAKENVEVIAKKLYNNFLFSMSPPPDYLLDKIKEHYDPSELSANTHELNIKDINKLLNKLISDGLPSNFTILSQETMTNLVNYNKNLQSEKLQKLQKQQKSRRVELGILNPKISGLTTPRPGTSYRRIIHPHCPNGVCAGGSNKIHILGRNRKITIIGRTKYITYKKEQIKLSDARKLENKLKI